MYVLQMYNTKNALAVLLVYRAAVNIIQTSYFVYIDRDIWIGPGAACSVKSNDTFAHTNATHTRTHTQSNTIERREGGGWEWKGSIGKRLKS